MERSLQSFLEKYLNIIPLERVIKEACVRVAKTHNIELSPEHISYSNGVIFLRNIPHTRKHAIFVKKKLLLEALKEELGVKAPKDIR